jgi:hypothetical protein
MSTAAVLLETVVRPSPFGVAFRDAATGERVSEGLSVTLTRNGRPARLAVNRSGIWFAPRVPGLSDQTLADTDDWATLARDYTLEVRDTFGRFLPLRVTASLPQRGLYSWPDWPTLPRPPLIPLVVDPPAGPVASGWLPLFSAATRTAPAPMAEVRAQLIDRATGAPAAWTLVTASYGARVRALGMSGADGQLALFFPYPPLPQPSIATSPPAITDYRWPIALAAYRQTLPADRPPDLAALTAQLAHPVTLFADDSDPLPPQLLSLGRPLTVRTANSSALLLGSD